MLKVSRIPKEKLLITTMVLMVVSIFLFFRFYLISSSLLFFNDIGRDFLQLFNWLETGKPPLLGPQTSALPFNQSAIYFYILFPFYLITQHSPFATIIAAATWYVGWYAIGLWWLRGNVKHMLLVSIIFLLIAVQPQQVIQGRFIWNPSFITPLIVGSLFMFWSLTKEYTQQKVVLWAGMVALATGFSYSVVPVMLAYMILLPFYFGRKSVWLYGWLIISLAVVNAPTLFFELRHDFLLTNMMLNQEKLAQDPSALTVATKTRDLFRYVLATNTVISGWLLFVMVFIGGIYTYVLHQADQLHLIMKSRFFSTASVLILTLLITYLAPIPVHAHYIFGILAVWLTLVCLLPGKMRVLMLVLLLVLWLKPDHLRAYFTPAHRSVAQTQACAQMLCQNHSDPMFVSVQSGLHPYHNGMEFQYLFKEAGCNIKTLDNQIDQASKMVVVVEHSQYIHGQTSYNELTQFGQSEEIEQIGCLPTLQFHLLQKTR